MSKFMLYVKHCGIQLLEDFAQIVHDFQIETIPFGRFEEINCTDV